MGGRSGAEEVGVKKRNRRLSSRSKTCVDQKTFYKTFRFVSKQAFLFLAQTRSSALLSPLDTSRKNTEKKVERLRHFLNFERGQLLRIHFPQQEQFGLL